MILHLGYFGPATTHEVKGEEELISLHYITVATLLLAWRWRKEILSNFVNMEFNKTDQGSFLVPRMVNLLTDCLRYSFHKMKIKPSFL